MRTSQTALDDYVRRHAFVREKMNGCSDWPTTTLARTPTPSVGGTSATLGRAEQVLDDLLAIFDSRPECRRPR